MGQITSQGPAIIYKLLCETSSLAVKLSPEVKTYFEKVQSNDRDRKKIAVVATGHYLAKAMLARLKQNKPRMPRKGLTKAA